MFATYNRGRRFTIIEDYEIARHSDEPNFEPSAALISASLSS
jgi:hypothetical protein